LFLTTAGRITQELAYLCLLLQSAPIVETEISAIQIATHRFPVSSMMDNPISRIKNASRLDPARRFTLLAFDLSAAAAGLIALEL
jgi:hypothetical protein